MEQTLILDNGEAPSALGDITRELNKLKGIVESITVGGGISD